MRKENILVVFSTHLSERENEEFKKHISETIGVKHEIKELVNFNQFSLPQVYNEALDECKDKKSIILFIHNDVKIKTKNWGKILLNKFNNSEYGILGIAGTSFIPESGRWWEDRSKMCGIVEHTNGVSQWVSEYSNETKEIQDVVHIDGLFMAVYPERIVHNFDENYGMFHFYDISFNLPNYLSGVDIGVITDIRVLHKSIGETNQEWEDNRIKFVENYKDELPLKLVKDPYRVLICCQFFKNYTGSEVSNFELSKELVKLGCDVTIVSTVIGDPLLSKAKKAGVDVYQLSNTPNFKMIPEKQQLMFYKNEKEFDIIHINHKPIGEQILKLYPNTPAVMHVRSEVIPVFEEPIINPQIKRYISIRDSITEYIKSFGVSEDKIDLIDNPFDYNRFHKNYVREKNEKEIILFIGTLDYLRKNILFDLKEMVEKEDKILWIIGSNNEGYADDLLKDSNNIRYFGIKSNVEDYIKKCDFTAGIFKGRTTIEGFLCGKSGWIYKVDEKGSILSKKLTKVPDDINKYRSDFSAKKVFKLYGEVIDETWFM